MTDKFHDDSSMMSVNPPQASSPMVNAQDVNSPNTQTPSGDGIVGRMLESVGLRVDEGGSA